MENQKKEQKKQKEPEMFSITCLLENFSEALIEAPEDSWDMVIEKLEQAIKSEDFFNVEEYGGSIEISGRLVDSLNTKKVIAFIYY